MKNKPLIFGSIWSISKFLINIFRSLVLVPFFLTIWNEEIFAYWIVIFSILTLIQTLNLGYTQYFGNLINLNYSLNKNKTYAIFQRSLKLLSFICIVQISISLLLLFETPTAFFLNIEVGKIKELNLLNSISYFLIFGLINHLVLRVFPKLFEAVGRVDITAKVNVLSYFFEICFMGLLLIFFKVKIDSMLMYLGFYYLLSSLCVIFYVKSRLPVFFHYHEQSSLKLAYLDFKKSLGFLFTNIIEKLNSESFPLIITHLLSIALVPVFFTIRTITNMTVTAGDLFLGLLIPDMQKSYSLGENKKTLYAFHFYWIFVCGIINLGTVLFFPYVEIAFDYWVNSKISFNNSLFSILMINALIMSYGSVFLYFLKSINKVEFILKATIIKTIIIYSFIIIFERTIENLGFALLISNVIVYLLYLNFKIYNLISHLNFTRYIQNIFISILPFIVTIAYILLWSIFHNLAITLVSLLLLIFIYFVYQKNYKSLSS